MEKALEAKVKYDIRRDQMPVSRFLNDISGTNNTLAKQVVHDVKKEIFSKYKEESKDKYSAGQRFIASFVFMNDLPGRDAAEKYNKSGYKTLNEEYLKYKENGGIKKSKKRVADDNRAYWERKHNEAREREKEQERDYERERRQRERETKQAINQMNSMYNYYNNRGY